MFVNCCYLAKLRSNSVTAISPFADITRIIFQFRFLVTYSSLYGPVTSSY